MRHHHHKRPNSVGIVTEAVIVHGDDRNPDLHDAEHDRTVVRGFQHAPCKDPACPYRIYDEEASDD